MFARLKPLLKLMEPLAKILQFFGTPALGIAVVAFIFVKINDLWGYYPYNIENPVDKESCTCDCWDGFYRSKYPRTSHDSEYKIFYFNYEKRFLPVIYLVLLTIKISDVILAKLSTLLFEDLKLKIKNISAARRSTCQLGSLRILSAFNALCALASHWYAAWVCINYLNEFDDRMIRSQVFFMITEFIPMYIYYKTMNRFEPDEDKPSEPTTKNEVSLEHLLPIACISCLHLYLALNEQVLWGLFLSTHRHNLIRDIVLVSADIYGLVFFVVYFLKIKIAQLRSTIYQILDLKERNHSHRPRVSIAILTSIWIAFILLAYQFYNFYCNFTL